MKARRQTVNDENLDAKARFLAVQYDGAGAFRVGSGSEPGVVYAVDADPEQTGQAAPQAEWTCSCDWGMHNGGNCSHVRAAARWVERAQARRARAAARQTVAA